MNPGHKQEAEVMCAESKLLHITKVCIKAAVLYHPPTKDLQTEPISASIYFGP